MDWLGFGTLAVTGIAAYYSWQVYRNQSRSDRPILAHKVSLSVDPPQGWARAGEVVLVNVGTQAASIISLLPQNFNSAPWLQGGILNHSIRQPLVLLPGEAAMVSWATTISPEQCDPGTYSFGWIVLKYAATTDSSDYCYQATVTVGLHGSNTFGPPGIEASFLDTPGRYLRLDRSTTHSLRIWRFKHWLLRFFPFLSPAKHWIYDHVMRLPGDPPASR